MSVPGEETPDSSAGAKATATTGAAEKADGIEARTVYQQEGTWQPRLLKA
jgi:hypothetical protein